MTNTPWEAASPRYKKFVFSAMALMGFGIILAIIGANIPSRPLVFTAIGIMVVGMLLQLGSLLIRARDVRAWRIANGFQVPRKKSKK